MKKLLLLSLLACCCLLTSCEKGGSHALDGSKWECDGEFIYFSDGYAQYEDEQAVSYSVKGDEIQFSRNLASVTSYYGIVSWEYDNYAILDKDRSSFTIKWWKTKGSGPQSGTETYIRVIK